jgi:flagellum-specific peptidoglycan hydrolase FlgJ
MAKKRKTMPLIALSILASTTLQSFSAYGMEITENENPVTENIPSDVPVDDVEQPEIPENIQPEQPVIEEETSQSSEETITNPSEGVTTETNEPSKVPAPTVPSQNVGGQTVGDNWYLAPNDFTVTNGKLSQEAAVTPNTLPTTPIVVVKNGTTELFIHQIGETAREIGQEHGLYASVMLAQAILETGSGGSQLSQAPYFNLFGIKGEYEGQSVIMPTSEDDGHGNMYTIDAAFRQYPGYKESLTDYAKLLKEGTKENTTIYQKAWKENALSYKAATQALTGVYATDTKYDQKLNALIETYNLTQYDLPKALDSSAAVIIAATHPDSDFKAYSGESYSGAEHYAAGNCTQYAYNRIVQLGGHIDVNMGNGMDWAANGKARGYEVSNTPKAGTAVSFQPGEASSDPTYGHVAFVEHVYEDQSILISEMNVAGEGIVSFRKLEPQVATSLSYIVPKE